MYDVEGDRTLATVILICLNYLEGRIPSSPALMYAKAKWFWAYPSSVRVELDSINLFDLVLALRKVKKTAVHMTPPIFSPADHS